MCAALVIGEVVRRVRHSLVIAVRESALAAVGTRQPAEEVVERPVLHHQYHEVVDPGVGRLRQRDGRLHTWRGRGPGTRPLRQTEHRRAAEQCRALDK